MWSFGRLLLYAGLGVAAAGLLVMLISRFNLPFGKLPGDVMFQRGRVSVFAPFASMLIVSVALTVILNVLIRLFRK